MGCLETGWGASMRRLKYFRSMWCARLLAPLLRTLRDASTLTGRPASGHATYLLLLCLASPSLLCAKGLVDVTHWVGNTFPGNQRQAHVQQVVNDIYVTDNRIFANATWDEGFHHVVAFSTENGDIIGTATTQSLSRDWTEGAYGITADQDYVYAGGLWKNYDSKQKKDLYHNVVWRFDHDLNNANFNDRKKEANFLILSSSDNFFDSKLGHLDDTKIRGMVEYEGELFVSDPIRQAIVVVRTSDMTILEDRSIAMKRPGWMTVDTNGKLWVVDIAAQAVKQVTRGSDNTPGVFTGVEITDIKVPTDLCINGAGHLLVCDNGVDKQEIVAYSLDGKRLGTHGRPAYGLNADDAFFGLTGVDVDADNNLYVATNGLMGSDYVDYFHGRVGRGAEIHKHNTALKREWTLYGLEWVTCGDLDPETHTDYFTTENWMTIDFSQPSTPGTAQKNWVVKGNTLDPVRYPNDLRMHMFVHSARVERIEGERFLIIGSDRQFQFYGIYRVDDDGVAVPVGLLSSNYNFKDKMTGEKWPSNAPNRPGLWLDRDNDGDFDTDEFKAYPQKLNGWGYGDMQVLPDGALLFHDNQQIYYVPCGGLDANKVPQWDFADMVISDLPESDITDLVRVVYVPEGDVLLIGCFSEANPNPREFIGKVAGTELRCYENGATLFNGKGEGTIKRRWLLGNNELPFRASDGGHHGRIDKYMPTAVHAVDDEYFFVGYDMHSEPEPNGEHPSEYLPDVRVYRMKDKSFVGLLEPQANINYETGALDFAQPSISLHKLPDGRYVIFTEDYHGGKNPYYLWKP